VTDRPSAADIDAHNARVRDAWAKIGNSKVAKPARKCVKRIPGKPKAILKRRSTPDYEEMLAGQLKLAGITGFIRQYRFCMGRKYRADFFFPERNLIVEIEGQIHAIKGRWKASFERDQAIFFLLIRLLKVSTAQVRSGAALTVIERALKAIPPYPKSAPA
jgi:very-short-patch-repair endonuclease